MEGSTPDWAEAEDYATLEEVFNSRTFGQALPEVAAVAVPVAAATAVPTGLARNRTIATFAVAAAALSVVAAVVTVGTGRTGRPMLSTQASGPSHVPSFNIAPQPTSPSPTGRNGWRLREPGLGQQRGHPLRRTLAFRRRISADSKPRGRQRRGRARRRGSDRHVDGRPEWLCPRRDHDHHNHHDDDHTEQRDHDHHTHHHNDDHHHSGYVGRRRSEGWGEHRPGHRPGQRPGHGQGTGQGTGQGNGQGTGGTGQGSGGSGKGAGSGGQASGGGGKGAGSGGNEQGNGPGNGDTPGHGNGHGPAGGNSDTSPTQGGTPTCTPHPPTHGLQHCS